MPYKGPLSDTVYQMIGGLRSSMGYCGTATIDDLRANGEFIRITNNGLTEEPSRTTSQSPRKLRTIRYAGKRAGLRVLSFQKSERTKEKSNWLFSREHYFSSGVLGELYNYI